MAARLVNLTPHPLVFLPPSTPDTVATEADLPEPLLVLASSGVARVAMTVERDADVDLGNIQLPVSRTRGGQVTGVPAAEDGVLYAVSLATYRASTDRGDLLVVDGAVRDAAGRIIGARGLARPQLT